MKTAKDTKASLLFAGCFQSLEVRHWLGWHRRGHLARVLDSLPYIWGYISMSRGFLWATAHLVPAQSAFVEGQRLIWPSTTTTTILVTNWKCQETICHRTSAGPMTSNEPLPSLPGVGSLRSTTGWHQRGRTWHSVLLLNSNFGMMLVKDVWRGPVSVCGWNQGTWTGFTGWPCEAVN